MKNFIVYFVALFLSIFLTNDFANAEVILIGQRAPVFSATDSDGKTQTLKQYEGRIVVLEWVNPECPFVKKHYGSGNMQQLQKKVVDEGGVWLSVNSSAPGKQGNLTEATAKEFVKKVGSNASAVILDSSGVVGRTYGAKTTPHMFVIDRSGILRYAGAIDDRASTDAADILGSKNYVKTAFEELNDQKPVTTSSTEPYGCGVKY